MPDHVRWPCSPVQVHGRLAQGSAIPPAEGIVTRAISVRSFRAVTAAACIDDVRVDCADVLDVDSQLAAGRSQIAGQEYVGIGRKAVNELLALLRREVDRDRPLAPAV